MKNISAFLTLTSALLLALGAQGQQANNPKALGPQPHRLTAGTGIAHHPADPQRGGGAPANDGCGSASAQALAVGGNITFSGNNTGATIDGDYESGSQLEAAGFASVWHAFTINSCANVTLSYCGSDAAFAGNFWVVISSACPAGDETMVFNAHNWACDDGVPILYFSALPAGTYYVPILTDAANGIQGPYTITATASACASVPANDECNAAFSLTPNTWCNFSTYSSDGGTMSLASSNCNTYPNTPNDDVWFSFAASATTMTIGAQGAMGPSGDNTTGFDAVIDVYDDCAGTNLLGCADATLGGEAEEVVLTGLSVGTPYYFRVLDYYDGYWPDQTFGVCVVQGDAINLGVHELTNADAWSVYPNPGEGLFNFQYGGAEGKGTIEVFDPTGRLVHSEQAALVKGGLRTLDLSGLAAGNYNVRLTINGSRTTQRLTVK